MAVQLFLVLWREEGESVAYGLKAREVLQYLLGCLGANAWNAWNVVHTIASERLQIGPDGNGYAGLLLDALGSIDLFVLSCRIPHDDIVVQALLQILVSGDNDHRPLF